MAKKKQSDQNVTKLSRFPTINLGLFLFLIILIYTMYFVVQYVTQEHISVYEVEEGTIIRDSVYTGIAVREEIVVTADTDTSAVISYYASAGEKVGTSTLVYSLSSSDSITELYADEASGDAASLDEEDLSELFSQLGEFTATYDDLNFSEVYTLASSINNTLTGSLNTSALTYLQEADADSGVELYYASEPGVIMYYIDGYEDLTADDVTSEMIEARSSDRTTFSTGDTVSASDVVYKLTNDENWQVVISVSESMAEELAELSVVEVTFAKDDRSAWATVSIRHEEEDVYLAVLSFTNSMSRYAEDRFLTVTLDLDDVSGLKIPNSAITEKEFYLISKDFVTYDESEDSYTLTILEEDGTTTVIYPDVYAETDEDYYIINDALSTGVTIIAEDGSKDTVYETAYLKGCYNINKGYAVFKQIDILYESENYTIISKDTDYGLAQFDYIALNADTVTEGEIIN